MVDMGARGSPDARTSKGTGQMALSNYWQAKLNSSTCCHAVELQDGMIGVYNGLTSWGVVIAADGNTVIKKLWLSPEIDEETGEEFQPSFTPQDFEQAGYPLA
jgi:hypothetical protein